MYWTLDFPGVPCFFQKLVPGATPTGVDAAYLNPQGNFAIRFTAGGAGTPQAGDLLTGATSGAKAILRQIVLESGTWAGSNAVGVLICDYVSGTFQAENLNCSGRTVQNTIAAVAAGCTWNVPAAKGNVPQAMLVCAETQAAMFTINGEPPTPFGGTNIGTKIPIDGSISIRGADSIKNFKCIDHTAASATTVKCALYY